MERLETAFQRMVMKEEEKQYITVPFSVPDHVDVMEISYDYDRTSNIIDFGLLDEKGGLIGWSGSDRSRITLSEWKCSAGFAPGPVRKGQWSVLLGAYHVQPEGVEVTCQVTYSMKEMQLLKGDTHVHSCGSDGNMTPDELLFAAEKAGIDYLFITDHNNYAQNDLLSSTERVTMLPGVEWTHYRGHAGMLGRKRPFNHFISNSLEKTRDLFDRAKDEGALIVLNHPFCPQCGWQWGLEAVSYDLIELWNGALMRESNEACLDWWDGMLKQGKRIPVTGGSDFHKYEPGRMPASPCTCVYAMSRGRSDILAALKQGNSFITMSADGPLVYAEAGDRLIGDELPGGSEITFEFRSLKGGDRICLIHDEGIEEINHRAGSDLTFTRKAPLRGYYRAEVRRTLPGWGEIPILITNPFYLAGEHDVE